MKKKSDLKKNISREELEQILKKADAYWQGLTDQRSPLESLASQMKNPQQDLLKHLGNVEQTITKMLFIHHEIARRTGKKLLVLIGEEYHLLSSVFVCSLIMARLKEFGLEYCYQEHDSNVFPESMLQYALFDILSYVNEGDPQGVATPQTRVVPGLGS